MLRHSKHFFVNKQGRIFANFFSKIYLFKKLFQRFLPLFTGGTQIQPLSGLFGHPVRLAEGILASKQTPRKLRKPKNIEKQKRGNLDFFKRVKNLGKI